MGLIIGSSPKTIIFSFFDSKGNVCVCVCVCDIGKVYSRWPVASLLYVSYICTYVQMSIIKVTFLLKL